MSIFQDPAQRIHDRLHVTDAIGKRQILRILAGADVGQLQIHHGTIRSGGAGSCS